MTTGILTRSTELLDQLDTVLHDHASGLFADAVDRLFANPAGITDSELHDWMNGDAEPDLDISPSCPGSPQRQRVFLFCTEVADPDRKHGWATPDVGPLRHNGIVHVDEHHFHPEPTGEQTGFWRFDVDDGFWEWAL